MKCPWCGFDGAPRALHAHFGDTHREQVVVEDRGKHRFYGITCPVCGDSYEHVVKPRLRDPSFAEEFSHEIQLVAFDMLVNHLIVEHEEV